MTPALKFPRGLYGITPEWDDAKRLMRAIEAAATGGMTALQWRRKTIDQADALPQARAVAALCRELGVCFIVNDDWRFAAAIDADGVHIGREDGPLSDARIALGPDKILGCSCYNEPALAEQALRAGADYVAFGAMYPSMVKPGAVRATLDHIHAGRELATQLADAGARAAVIAIGGITPANAAPIVAAGADSIAVISGLFEAPDIRAAAQACSALFM
ncbi:MAG TPA: thiamine phosphate synthase [Burkholderiaceae bacterium]|nr:thiamine phosphate synthase [Burkholderiaceae bacterium]